MARFPQDNPIQGSPLIGTPITVTVVPATHQPTWTFHRLILRVYAALVIPDVTDPNYPGDYDYTQLEFSTPIANNNPVKFDISSALKAVSDRYVPDALPPSQQPYVKFRVEAWDEWMVDGTIRQNDAVLLPGKMEDTEILPTNLIPATGWGTVTTIGWQELTPPLTDGSGGISLPEGKYAFITPQISWGEGDRYVMTFVASARIADPEIFYANMQTKIMAFQSDNFQEEELQDGKYRYTAFFNCSYKTEEYRLALMNVGQGVYLYDIALKQVTRQNIELLYFYAFIGELTDMERLLSSDSRSMTRWTRKPSDVPEVVFCGEEMVRPINFQTGLESDHASEDIPPHFVSGAPEGGPRSMTYDIGPNEGLQTRGNIETGLFQVYAIHKPQDGYVLRFCNRLGCIETIFIRALAQKQVKMETEQYTIARQETLNKFSRSLAVKSGNVEQWKMTSGPVSEQWSAWFTHELMMVADAWVKVGTTWLRCHLLPEETITLVDRTKTDPMEVQFTLQLDIEGSPLSALTI